MRTRYFIATIICVLIFNTHNLFSQTEEGNQDSKAEEQKPKTTENTTPLLSTRYFLASFNIGYGFTYPNGTVTGNGSQTRKWSNGYSAGFSGGFFFDDLRGVTLGFDYLHENIKIHRSFANKPAEYELSMDFLNLMLGYEGYFKCVYWETGLLFGYKILSWKESISVSGQTNTSTLDGKRSSWAKNAFGGYLGCGYVYHLTDKVLLKGGIRCETTFTPAYDNGSDKIKPFIAEITVGISYKIPYQQGN